MKPRPIKNLLSEFLNGKDFKAINETICLTTAWKQSVGEPILKNTEILDFKNGKPVLAAFAIWDGANQDNNANKMVSFWQVLTFN